MFKLYVTRESTTNKGYVRNGVVMLVWELSGFPGVNIRDVVENRLANGLGIETVIVDDKTGEEIGFYNFK